ncbi:MAG: amidohydrolase family protein [Rubricoccaceae bacterium]|nr:amidohydrolase family protein [Rubricoccaceae bacterium]
MTIDAARILGIDHRVGSIEEGKDADLVLFDGDPLEYTSHVCAVIVDGVVVREECR